MLCWPQTPRMPLSILYPCQRLQQTDWKFISIVSNNRTTKSLVFDQQVGRRSWLIYNNPSRSVYSHSLWLLFRYSPPVGTGKSPSVSSIISRSSQKKFTCADLQPSGKSSSPVLIYPIPYSEHSSFYELTCFAMSFNWTKMIATVNVGSEANRKKMFNWVSKWEAERKKRGKDIIITHRHPDYWWPVPTMLFKYQWRKPLDLLTVKEAKAWKYALNRRVAIYALSV